MKKLRILLFAFFCTTLLFSQQKIIDSLEKIVNNTKLPDKDKIIPLTELTEYYRKKDTIQALRYAQRAVSSARKQKDNEKAVYAYSALMSAYVLKKDIRPAYIMMDSCFWYIDNITNKKVKAYGLNKIADNKQNLDDREGIIDLLLESNRLAESSKDWNMVYKNYYCLMRYYLTLDIDNLKKYAFLSLKIAGKNKNPDQIAKSWIGIGAYYAKKHMITPTPALLDSSISANKKAIAIYKKQESYLPEWYYYNALMNIANAFAYKNMVKKEKTTTDSISYYAKKALIETEKSNDISFQMNCYLLLHVGEEAKGNYIEAERLILKAISIISKYEGHAEVKVALYTNLAMLYELMKRFDKATEYYKTSLESYQKYYNEKYMKVGQQQEAKYQFEKKEQEVQFRKKQNILYLGITGILFLSLLFLFFTFKFRVRYLKQKKEEAFLLAKLKEEEKLNAELDAQLKTERANKLEKEVLSKTAQVSYKNEMLENLKQNIKDNPEFTLKNLNQIIKNENILDRNFDDFEKVVKETDARFYNRLQERAQQKLTTLDLKYCIYIYMKIPSKEMADLLHVEIKTVRMNKYRLKQKLGLGKEESLENFIQENNKL